MGGFHFSLRWLFGVVSFLAVGCGLLIYVSTWLSTLTFTAVLFAMLAAATAAVYQRGVRRAFWGGFAVFGFIYLAMVCGSWHAPDSPARLRERLVTSQLLDWCYQRLPLQQRTLVGMHAATESPYSANVFDPYVATAPGAMPGGPGPMSASIYTAVGVDRGDFLTTGHALFSILFATLGGLFAKRCQLSAGHR